MSATPTDMLVDVAWRLVNVIEGADALIQKGFSTHPRIHDAAQWARSEVESALAALPREAPRDETGPQPTECGGAAAMPIHTPCGTALVEATRTVISMPEDGNWPRDRPAIVPWCPACREVVGMRAMRLRTNPAPATAKPMSFSPPGQAASVPVPPPPVEPCEGTCDPHVAACGAQFCTPEEARYHNFHACGPRLMGTTETP